MRIDWGDHGHLEPETAPKFVASRACGTRHFSIEDSTHDGQLLRGHRHPLHRFTSSGARETWPTRPGCRWAYLFFSGDSTPISPAPIAALRHRKPAPGQGHEPTCPSRSHFSTMGDDQILPLRRAAEKMGVLSPEKRGADLALRSSAPERPRTSGICGCRYVAALVRTCSHRIEAGRGVPITPLWVTQTDASKGMSAGARGMALVSPTENHCTAS